MLITVTLKVKPCGCEMQHPVDDVSLVTHLLHTFHSSLVDQELSHMSKSETAAHTNSPHANPSTAEALLLNANGSVKK